MSGTIDLGQVRICHDSAGLSCALKSTAVFACSNPGSDALHGLESADQLISSAYWVARAANLHIVLDIAYAVPLDSCIMTDLFEETIVNLLQHARLWERLQFEPSITVTSQPSSNRPRRIIIALSYGKTSLAPETTRAKAGLHRLAQNVPCTDVKPPPGSVTLLLEQIRLEVMFDQDVRVQSNVSPSLQQTGIGRSPCSEASQIDSLQGSAVFVQPTELQPSAWDYDSLMFDADREDDMLLTDVPEAQALFLRKDFSGSCPHVLFTSRCLLDDDTAYFDMDLDNQPPAPDCTVNSIVDLIDAAIRLAISSNHGKLGAGIKVTERQSFRHLTDIAPSLFRPGHVQATAARSVFLPTISRALSNAGLARSGQLRRKFEAITTRCHDLQRVERQSHELTIDEAAKIHVQSTRDAINMHLWQMIQQRTYGSVSDRRVESLHRASDELKSATAMVEPIVCDDLRSVELVHLAENLFSDQDGRVNESVNWTGIVEEFKIDSDEDSWTRDHEAA